MLRRAVAILCGLLDRVLCHSQAAPLPQPPVFSAGRRVHIPTVQHATLPPDPQRLRTIVVGDVHGCLDELQELLSVCDYNPQTTRVVLVGDLVNKGPKSAECVRFVREKGFACVRGNHDDAALFAWERRQAERRDGGSPFSQIEDKYAYVDQFDDADVQFLREMPHTLRLPELEAIVVHAGLVPGVPLEAQEAAAMITMRNLLRPQSKAADVTTANLKAPQQWSHKAKQGVGWATAWAPDDATLANVSCVIFGHDAKRGLQQEAFATGLDTGACYGKKLTALVLERHKDDSIPPEEYGGSGVKGGVAVARRIVSVRSARVYSEPGSK